VSHDVIVIGAGVNGMVAALLLAKSGKRVLVLERRTEPGTLHETGWVPPSVARELGLAERGLAASLPDPWITVPLDGGGRLELSHDVAQSAAAIHRVSAKDAAKWPTFCARMHRLAGVLALLYEQPAPDVETRELGELLRMGLLGLKVRRLGKQAVIDLLRTLPMSASDLLDEWFENDALKGTLGALAVRHLKQGPRSGGTMFNLLHHHVGSAPGVFRQGTSNVRQVLEGLPGVDVRRGAAVRRIAVSHGAVNAIELASGESIATQTVVSGADPRTTLLELLAPGWLDPDFVRAVRNIKCRGIAAQVALTLDGPPGMPALVIAPSLRYLERAYDDAKYGRVSEQPYLETQPDGNTLVAHVQYVPHAPADGAWDASRRDQLGELVISLLEPHLPGLRQRLRHTSVTAPHDLSAQTGLTEGHAYHGEHTLDQILFMRPVAGWSRYRTPVRGLYLCGSGTHPGGGILGGPGRLAAREVLEDGAP